MDIKQIKVKAEELSKWIQAQKKAEEKISGLKVELDSMLKEMKMETLKSGNLTVYYTKGKTSYTIAKEQEAINMGAVTPKMTLEVTKDQTILEEAVDKGILSKSIGKPSLATRFTQSK